MSSGDYISLCEAQDAMTAENLIYNLDQVENGDAHRFARAAIRVLERLKPANVRPVVRGHWVWNPNGMDWGLGAWCCDQCRIKAETWWANDRRNNPLRCSGGRFCGNCGADMRPEQEPPAEAPAPICQTCGNFEICPWRHEGIFSGPKDKARRVVACSDYKPE